jgi:zinc/manganese transport system substrate-binding protein
MSRPTHPYRRRSFIAGLAGGAAGLAGLTGVGTPALARRQALNVITTFSILGDIVATIGGARVSVRSLIGPDQDSHRYDPRPTDARAIALADLVVRNGMGFEGWLDRLITASGFRASLVTASDGITPIFVRDTIPDPHVWQSFTNVKIYARNIELGLARLAPASARDFAANRARFHTQVDQAFARAKALMAPIPADKRLVVVPHNSFRYLGQELGLQFRGLRSLSTGGQPSAAGLAGLINEIKTSGAAAAFVENIGDERLIGQIAQQSGARVGGKLYSDALSPPGGPASTTLAMLDYNVRAIATTLGAAAPKGRAGLRRF